MRRETWFASAQGEKLDLTKVKLIKCEHGISGLKIQGPNPQANVIVSPQFYISNNWLYVLRLTRRSTRLKLGKLNKPKTNKHNQWDTSGDLVVHWIMLKATGITFNINIGKIIT